MQAENCNEDKDMDDFRNFNGILDEIAAHLPPELATLIRKVFSKHGKNGPFPDQQEVMRKDPWLADQVLREIRKADADGILPDINPNSMPGASLSTLLSTSGSDCSQHQTQNGE